MVMVLLDISHLHCGEHQQARTSVARIFSAEPGTLKAEPLCSAAHGGCQRHHGSNLASPLVLTGLQRGSLPMRHPWEKLFPIKRLRLLRGAPDIDVMGLRGTPGACPGGALVKRGATYAAFFRTCGRERVTRPHLGGAAAVHCAVLDFRTGNT